MSFRTSIKIAVNLSHSLRTVGWMSLFLSFILPGWVLAEDIRPDDLIGTWREGDQTLELDASGTFMIYNQAGFLPTKIQGEWHLEMPTILLEPRSGKIIGEPARGIQGEGFFFHFSISRTEKGEILLTTEDEVYQKHSDQTTFPWEWRMATKEDLKEPSESGWFIRPPVFPFPRMNIRVEPGENGSLTFRLRGSRNVTGIHQIDIWQPGDESPRWTARLDNSTRKMQLGYGDPLEPPSRQLIPQDRETPPRPLDRNLPFFVRLEVSYRLILPPSLGMDPMYYAFEFTGDGRVIQVSPERARGLNP